jgi:hypothetical protein
MDGGNSPQIQSIELSRLRPTQLTVGMLEVKHKRRRLRALEKRPAELVAFILEMPIRVVIGPAKNAYVIDHHHLGLALLKENFKSAPMHIEADFSHLRIRAFWKRMRADRYLHLVNAKGTHKPLRNLPRDLKCLKDDPYRSLAGFVRSAGGFAKTPTPFAEFQWADFFRQRISEKLLRKRFESCIAKGVRLAKSPAAAKLPGYIGRPPQRKGRK